MKKSSRHFLGGKKTVPAEAGTVGTMKFFLQETHLSKEGDGEDWHQRQEESKRHFLIFG
jgi:hypothetical protein